MAAEEAAAALKAEETQAIKAWVHVERWFRLGVVVVVVVGGGGGGGDLRI